MFLGCQLQCGGRGCTLALGRFGVGEMRHEGKMNKIGFLLSGLLALTGVNLVAFCALAQSLYPKIGYLIFQSESSGSYDPRNYTIDFSLSYALGLTCVAVGVWLSVIFCRCERSTKAV